ncbi:hypothetical protein QQP08_009013 [Theobroma cacao]|nr:hypothetical protein QQP08_009013 [Theobroma cacao]
MAFSNLSSSTTGMEGQGIVEEICLKFPPKVSSPGLAAYILSNEQNEKFTDFAASRLHFQMIVIFALTQIIHYLLKHLGLPIFNSQILAGILLGPMVFKGHNSLVTMSEDSVQWGEDGPEHDIQSWKEGCLHWFTNSGGASDIFFDNG